MRSYIGYSLGLILAALFAFVHAARAIECYECQEEDCLKPTIELRKEECSSLLKIRTCLTVFEDESQTKILSKRCGVQDEVLSLKQQKGCKNVQMRDQGHKLAFTCFCDKDLCNSAYSASWSSSVFLIFVLSTVVGVVLGRF